VGMTLLRIVILLGVLGAFVVGCSRTDPAEESQGLREDYARVRLHLMQKQRAEGELRRRRPDLVPIRLLALPPETKARFRLDLLDFDAGVPYRAETMAKADLAEGHFNILTGGVNVYTAEVCRFLQTRYGIVVVSVASCTDGDDIFKVMDAYNEVVEDELPRKFGKNLDDMLREAEAYRED